MRQQLMVATGSIILLFALYFFGRTKPYPKAAVTAARDTASSVRGTEEILSDARKKLTPSQLAWVTAQENSISRGDLVSQKIALYGRLADFWRDSVKQFEPYAWYLGEKAKLENTEKSLNFAAQSYLEALKSVSDPSLKSWMANQAQDLFDRVLAINPANDSAKVGWGSTFIYGASGTTSPMEGIMKIREVAQRDSNNMYAQFMLGYGAMLTGQYDRAVDRLNRVVGREPGNTEAIFLLAEAYERSGDRAKAVEWLKVGRKNVSDPDLLRAIDEKIKSLQ